MRLRATCFALLLAGASVALAGDAPAHLDLAAVDAQIAEGSKWFDVSGNPDLSAQKRNDARVTAYGILKKALRTLDDWCDAHSEDVDKLDARMVELHRTEFWLKKESPVSLTEGAGSAPPAPAPAPSQPPTAPLPPTETPSTPPAPKAPPPDVPRPVAPAPPVPARRDLFAEAAAYEKSHPSDEPGMLDRWLEALNSSDESASDRSRDALARVARLSEALKQYYRKVRNEDPDALDPEKDAGKAADLAAKLAGGLNAADPAERRAAAGRLADLGYSPAGVSLYEALRREKTADVRRDYFLALVRIGGRRTCENLAKFAKERGADLPAPAVESLAAVAQKDAVQARYAAGAMAEFVIEARAPDAAHAAIDALRHLGPAGVPALVKAISTKDAALESDVIAALGDAKDARGAPVLCDRLDSDSAASARSTAAQAALKSIGRPAIPALIESLKKKKPRRLAAVLLYDLCGGQTFGEDAHAWADWWRTQK